MKYKAITCVLFSLLFSGCELLDGGTLPLSDSEIIRGLKEALNTGTDASVSQASATGGYLQNEVLKILLPQEVQTFKNKIDQNTIASIAYTTYIATNNNGNDLFDELITSMNRGAEAAASKAAPIFLDAITTMSIDDARGILNGGNTSATDYFERTTSTVLFNEFQPEIKTALDQTGANTVYTKTFEFLSVKPGGFLTPSIGELLNISLEPSLDAYATNRAIDGLFFLVGEEEKNIRADPFSYGKRIFERVFGNQ